MFTIIVATAEDVWCIVEYTRGTKEREEKTKKRRKRRRKNLHVMFLLLWMNWYKNKQTNEQTNKLTNKKERANEKKWLRKEAPVEVLVEADDIVAVLFVVTDCCGRAVAVNRCRRRGRRRRQRRRRRLGVDIGKRVRLDTAAGLGHRVGWDVGVAELERLARRAVLDRRCDVEREYLRRLVVVVAVVVGGGGGGGLHLVRIETKTLDRILTLAAAHCCCFCCCCCRRL